MRVELLCFLSGIPLWEFQPSTLQMAIKNEISILNQFINDKCKVSPNFRIEKRKFFDAFLSWMKSQKKDVSLISMNALSREMILGGFVEIRTKTARCWAGICLSNEKQGAAPSVSFFPEDETVKVENPELITAKVEQPKRAVLYEPFQKNVALEDLLMRRMSGVVEG